MSTQKLFPNLVRLGMIKLCGRVETRGRKKIYTEEEAYARALESQRRRYHIRNAQRRKKAA